MAADDGGPAFPVTREHYDDSEPGMSLRDWFAGMAVAGALNSQAAEVRLRLVPESLAREAYALADALIAERGKT